VNPRPVSPFRKQIRFVNGQGDNLHDVFSVATGTITDGNSSP